MRLGEAFREWDELDFLAAGGMLMLAGGLVSLLVPRLRRIEVLFPIGAGVAMMAAAGFGARHGDDGTISDKDDEAVVARPGETALR
jgi:hypothetical protein